MTINDGLGIDKLCPKVFIVDDEEDVRSGIADLVASMQLAVATFGSAEEFLVAFNPLQTGCLLLDLQMPGITGIDLQRQLSEKNVTIPIIVISGHGDIASSVECMKLGAIDFIEKPFQQHVLKATIEKAISRDIQLKQLQTAKLRFLERQSWLTARELQIMKILVSGMSDKQIAGKLDISHRAITYHRSHILEKMGVTSVIELAKLISDLEH